MSFVLPKFRLLVFTVNHIATEIFIQSINASQERWNRIQFYIFLIIPFSAFLAAWDKEHSKKIEIPWMAKAEAKVDLMRWLYAIEDHGE